MENTKLAKIAGNSEFELTLTYNHNTQQVEASNGTLVSDGKKFDDIDQAYEHVCAMYNSDFHGIWTFQDLYA